MDRLKIVSGSLVKLIFYEWWCKVAIEAKIFCNLHKNTNLTFSQALCFYGTYRQYFKKWFKVILEVNSTCQMDHKYI